MEARDELRRRNVKPPMKFWDDHKFYDELIFDAGYFTRSLPRSVEAIFYIFHGDCSDIGARAMRARVRVHHAYVACVRVCVTNQAYKARQRLNARTRVDV